MTIQEKLCTVCGVNPQMTDAEVQEAFDREHEELFDELMEHALDAVYGMRERLLTDAEIDSLMDKVGELACEIMDARYAPEDNKQQ